MSLVGLWYADKEKALVRVDSPEDLENYMFCDEVRSVVLHAVYDDITYTNILRYGRHYRAEGSRLMYVPAFFIHQVYYDFGGDFERGPLIAATPVNKLFQCFSISGRLVLPAKWARDLHVGPRTSRKQKQWCVIL